MKHKNNLVNLTMLKQCTAQDVKVESLLVAVHSLLEEYIIAYENNLTKDAMSKEENILIYEKLKLVYEYLSKNIISAARLDTILFDSIKGRVQYNKAMLVEPISFFYDVIVKKYVTLTNRLFSSPEQQKTWIPEVLAIYLIIDIKESKYSFSRFPEVEKFDFTDILEIYKKYTLSSIKEKGSKILEKDPTKREPMSKMQSISKGIIKRLIESKYKDYKKK